MRRFQSILLIGLAVAAGPANADVLAQSALFARCYGQLTGHAVPRTHALASKVAAGAVDPIDACMEIFNKAMLGGNNMLASGRSDTEALAVLNHFNAFHRSWFPTTKIEDIIDHGGDTGQGTADVYDGSEPALAITYHMFTPNSKYQDVLRDGQGFVALRQENNFIRDLIGYNVTMPNRRIYGNNGQLDQNMIYWRKGGLPENLRHGFDGGDSSGLRDVSAVMPKIQVGDLVGVAPQGQSFTVPNIAVQPLGALTYGDEVAGLNYSYNFYQSFGGGVLGQPVYLMMNLGHTKGTVMTGAEKLPRRWMLNSMGTFLCTPFPALRASDASQFLNTTGTAPFRKSTSCLQCHGTLDQAAFTARNIISVGSEFNGSGFGAKSTDALTSFRPEVAPISYWSASPVPNFQRMTPIGKLYFRSFSGLLVDVPVTGIGGLGTAMSNTDDYYQCAAKRYFEFFTSISVPLYDRTDPRYATQNAALSTNDSEDRRFIENLGAQLKQNQSLPKLIQAILSSDYYKSRSYRPASQEIGQ